MVGTSAAFAIIGSECSIKQRFYANGSFEKESPYEMERERCDAGEIARIASQTRQRLGGLVFSIFRFFARHVAWMRGRKKVDLSSRETG